MELTDQIVREKHLTSLMVTHNLKFAVQYGNRLLMMHEGHAVIDAADTEKEKLQMSDLLDRFNTISPGARQLAVSDTHKKNKTATGPNRTCGGLFLACMFFIPPGAWGSPSKAASA